MSRISRPEMILVSALTSLAALALLCVGQAAPAQDTNQTGGGTLSNVESGASADDWNMETGASLDGARPEGDRSGAVEDVASDLRFATPRPAEAADERAVRFGQSLLGSAEVQDTNQLGGDNREYVSRRERWERGRHHGWRNNRRHRICRWTWRHHHRVRVCSWRRW